jgi:hypothetical protein
MRIPLREGRALSERDGAESLPVAVVGEGMVAPLLAGPESRWAGASKCRLRRRIRSARG